MANALTGGIEAATSRFRMQSKRFKLAVDANDRAENSHLPLRPLLQS
ncbi:hypothetical protein [uncultured Croceicoccus sp.]|nr:hypothetical protein [uncultured Croceicoccus sp.]